MSTQRMPESRWEPGAVVGDYRIERRLARGGMAELFVASPVEGPEQSVVIKRVHAHLRSDPGFDAMFVRETRIAASLHHPNIVRVLETGRVGDELYLVMELLVGFDGRALLGRLASTNSVLSYGDAIQIVIDAAAGLAYAHDCVGGDGELLGIVHRDVSPSNLFITQDGEVKLVDFGIAKTTNATQITGVGVRKGKGAYMAPEQCMAGVVDRRTDVFALGAVLYELTTMTRAYDGENELAVLHAITSREVDPPSTRVPDYPAALEAVVMAALARDPEKRWSDATALANALRELSGRREFQGSTTTLAHLVRGLLSKGGLEAIAEPSSVDLTPPPFGVSDRSDGSLLLPTPTNMAEITEEDSDLIRVRDDGAKDLVARRAETSGAYRIVSPRIAQTLIAPSAAPGASAIDLVRTAVKTAAAPTRVVSPAVAASTGSRSAPVAPAAVGPSAPPFDVDDVAPQGASLTGRVAAVVIFGLVCATALWWFAARPEQGAAPTSQGTADSAPGTPSQAGEAASGPGSTVTSPVAAAASSDPVADLARLNDSVTASKLHFAERHALIRGVTDAGMADGLNLPLNLYLDLVQAEQSTTPCATFRGAWGSLVAAGDEAFVDKARTNASAPTKPGDSEAPRACEGLGALLSSANAAPVSPPPSTSAEPRSASRPHRAAKPRREPTKEVPPPEPPPPATEPAAVRPRPPKPEVGGKLEDELRPFGR